MCIFLECENVIRKYPTSTVQHDCAGPDRPEVLAHSFRPPSERLPRPLAWLSPAVGIDHQRTAERASLRLGVAGMSMFGPIGRVGGPKP